MSHFLGDFILRNVLNLFLKELTASSVVIQYENLIINGKKHAPLVFRLTVLLDQRCYSDDTLSGKEILCLNKQYSTSKRV